MYIMLIYVPFMTSIIISVIGRKIGIRGVKRITKISIWLTWIISIIIMWEVINNEIIIKIKIGKWIESNDNKILYELIYEPQSVIMAFLIISISSVVFTYSFWYLKEEAHIIRFISNLFWFTSFMSLFVIAQNIILMFIGWEGIGICSYILINFWYTRIQANKSAMKAVLYNRIGDSSFIIGIIIYTSVLKNSEAYNIYYLITGTERIEGIEKDQEKLIIGALYLLSIASFTKSALFIFHPWLASSMEGPTPVSALLHAATMVTAGVYLIIKIEEGIKEIEGLQKWIIIYSVLTIIFSGLSSYYQKDIKKLIAFSTSSQIAIMFLGQGIIQNGSFHLLTHGYFKAVIFLIAGIIIHINGDNQDIRKLGNSIYKTPTLYSLILISSLTLSAFPFLSAYYSKDVIIENTYTKEWGGGIYVLIIIGSILTMKYTMKLIYETNWKEFTRRKSYYEKINEKEVPISIYIILLFLIIPSISYGYMFYDYYVGPGKYNYDYEFTPWTFKWIPTIILILVLIKEIKKKRNKIWNIENYSKNKYIDRNMTEHLNIDWLINTYIVKPLTKIAYTLFKVNERGILENIVISLYRLFFYLSIIYPYKAYPTMKKRSNKEIKEKSVEKKNQEQREKETTIQTEDYNYILYFYLSIAFFLILTIYNN